MSLMQRFAALCFRRRRRVLLVWILGIVRPRRGDGGRRHRVPLRLHAARRREQARHRHPRRPLRRPGRGPGRQHRVPGRAGRRRPRGPRRRWRPFLAEVAEIDGVQSVDQPVRARATRPRSPTGRPGRADRLRRGRGAVGRHRSRRRPRSAGRSGTRCPTSTACGSSSAARCFAEFEAPSSEVLGLAFAIVILILAFGSVLAMGLPIGVALAGIGVGHDDRRAALAAWSRCPTSPPRSAS